MAGYSSYGRQLCAQPDPHGESYGGSKKAGYFPRDPVAETWTVPASKNRGLSVPPGYRNEIGHTPSAAALRVDRQLHLDSKAYFRWTAWKARYFGLWGVIVPVGIYMAITNELVRTAPASLFDSTAASRLLNLLFGSRASSGEQRHQGRQQVQAGSGFPVVVN